MRNENLVSGFLKFVFDNYGITMTAEESDEGESFVDLYGYDFHRTGGRMTQRYWDNWKRCHKKERREMFDWTAKGPIRLINLARAEEQMYNRKYHKYMRVR